MGLKRICAFWDQISAGAAHSYLENCGLHPLPLNTAAHVFVAGADQWYYVEVPEEETEEARQLLIGAGGNRYIKQFLN